MKKYYFFLLLLVSLISGAQSNCSEADSDINYAYSHVKSAYDSNNISDLKYFANRSLEAFKRAEPVLKSCGCETVWNATLNGIEYLEKADLAETYEDGRFYVKRARIVAQESISELDYCNQITQEEEELLTLEMEQSKLKEKQLELERQQAELQRKLAEQRDKELRVQKEIIINNFESALQSNISSYNEVLRSCECNERIQSETFSSEALFVKSDTEIRRYYVDIIKQLSNLYTLKIESCLTDTVITTVDD